MGYYVQTKKAFNKADDICDQHGGKRLSRQEAHEASKDENRAVIVVMNNGPFEAAGFAYCHEEFHEFADDGRATAFVEIDRDKACELTGFAQAEAS
ncbi:MAG: hypothetical protein ABL309_13985 [Phycisphaerales bacterium]